MRRIKICSRNNANLPLGTKAGVELPSQRGLHGARREQRSRSSLIGQVLLPGLSNSQSFAYAVSNSLRRDLLPCG